MQEILTIMAALLFVGTIIGLSAWLIYDMIKDMN